MALKKTLKKLQNLVSKLKRCRLNLANRQTKENIQSMDSERILRLLGDAIEIKDRAQVEELLQSSELNSTELGDFLWLAIQNDEFEIASMLVKGGADLKLTKPSDYQKSSFLHEIVAGQEQKHHQLITLMIEHGADANAHDKLGKSVIYRAIEGKSSVEIIQDLLNRQVQVNEGLIDLATKHPLRVQVLPLLLNSGLFDEDRKVELVAYAISCLICVEGDESLMLPTVKVLLDMKLPITEIQDDGMTLDSAISRNRMKMVELLIKYGFDVNKPVLGVMLPLYAASSQQQSIITEMLIHAGANVNGRAADSRVLDGRFPLHAACQSKSSSNIQVLLRHGADVNVIDSKGHTPFSILLFKGHMTEAHKVIVKFLAISASKEQKINNCDLEIIESHPELLAFYTQCLNELEKMKATKIINNVSFFACFDKSMIQLAFLTRNCNFLKHYDLIQRKDYFPIYNGEIDLAMKNAVRHKESLSDREEVLCKSLENIVPYVPLDNIVYYFYFVDFE